MRSKTITALAVAGLLSAAVAGPVIGQDMLTGAEAMAKREQLMKSAGGLLRSAGGLSGDDAVSAGQQLVDIFAQLTELFPEDSMGGDALPVIWEDQEGFMLAMMNASQAAADVLAAAESGDSAAFGSSLRAMGATCGACHTKYRAED